MLTLHKTHLGAIFPAAIKNTFFHVELATLPTIQYMTLNLSLTSIVAGILGHSLLDSPRRRHSNSTCLLLISAAGDSVGIRSVYTQLHMSIIGIRQRHIPYSKQHDISLVSRLSTSNFVY